jgi:hypothetical protein
VSIGCRRSERLSEKGPLDRAAGSASMFVIVDERDDISARTVAVIDDGEAAAIDVEVDGDDFT